MIGQMRDRLELFKPTRVPDGGGGHAFSYASLGEIAARTDALRTGVDRSTEQVSRRRRHRFTIRSRDDLVYEMQLAYRGSRYRIIDIQALDNTARFTAIEGEEVPAP